MSAKISGSTDPFGVTRRRTLGAFAVASAALATGCSSPTTPSASASSSGSTSPTGTTGTASGGCAAAPSETAGPYPDRIGMLGNPAFLRRDITDGKPGLGLTLAINAVNTSNSCMPLSGAYVEIWQCDAEGHYSEYAQQGYDGTGQTFLRGVQATDAGGQVTFSTIYPGWYPGRATHIHVEVYVNGRSVKVTQIAFPERTTALVYGSGVYAAKGLNSTTNANDGVFADGVDQQLATLTGNTTSGYTATITLGVPV